MPRLSETRALAALLLVMVILAGCRDVATSEAAVGSASKAESPYPQIVLEDGTAIEVEVVSTPDARAKGLMFRRMLPQRHGMLFLFPGPEVQTFWMKNTLIPLDIIWIDEKMRVIEIITAPPCELDPCPSYGPDQPASYVLEIGGGEASRLGIEEGSVLRMRNIETTRGS